jgi:hypothetical protein
MAADENDQRSARYRPNLLFDPLLDRRQAIPRDFRMPPGNLGTLMRTACAAGFFFNALFVTGWSLNAAVAGSLLLYEVLRPTSG